MPPEVVTEVSFDTQQIHPKWWSTYRSALQEGNLSEDSIRVIDLDSSYIVDNGIFGVGSPESPSNNWPGSRLRKGLVVGSVQSGKTSSMLAVAAKALDRGVDIVAILGGTRIALWRQTFARAAEQLDGWSGRSDPSRGRTRVWIPDPAVILDSTVNYPSLATLYHTQSSLINRALKKRRPIISVVMKQTDHLIRFGMHLRGAVQRSMRTLNRPVHLLIIDDEADDGSILDAIVESGLDPHSELLKQIPRHIARLWAWDGPQNITEDHNLYATYVAYTATPQANVLQSSHNPLSPKDFLIALRTPGDSGNISPPRSNTFKEPRGIKKYYTGGEYFYRRIPSGKSGLVVPSRSLSRGEFATNEEFQKAQQTQTTEIISDALRSFFVSAAIRLAGVGKRYSDCNSNTGLPLKDVELRSPPPHSMLLHPSSSIDSQIYYAQWLAAWSIESEEEFIDSGTFPADDDGRPKLDVFGLERRLNSEEGKWKAWLDHFEETRLQIISFGVAANYSPIDSSLWPTIRNLLTEEVFPNASIRVINSHPDADDSPRFRPAQTDDGLYQFADDLLSIFVSGNVMSRGITLEGLSTSVFLRSTDAPTADTQAQMQRWLGYRGDHLHLCRVFGMEDQVDLFRSYHENDEALKKEILQQMNQLNSNSPSPLILQGANFSPTGKIANLRALPLCPGNQPFIGVIDAEGKVAGNLSVLRYLLSSNESSLLNVRGQTRGLFFNETFSLLQVAEILERFQYSDHCPNPKDQLHARWHSLELELSLAEPFAPLFRVPSTDSQFCDIVSPNACPYSIAAYLRLWSSCLTMRARGLFPTDNRRTPWSMLNLPLYAASAPRFYVGIRFGSKGVSNDTLLESFGIKCMKRQTNGSIVTSNWGSRNPGDGPDAYLGDHLVDYHISNLPPPIGPDGDAVWRPRGHPGLLLFHLLKTPTGIETLTAGLCLPLGGPDHFAAIRPAEPNIQPN